MSALSLKKEYQKGTLPDLFLIDLLSVLAVLHPYLYTRLEWTARHVLYLTQHFVFGISRHKEQSWIVSSIPNHPQSLQRQWKCGHLRLFPEASSVCFPLVQSHHVLATHHTWQQGPFTAQGRVAAQEVPQRRKLLVVATTERRVCCNRTCYFSLSQPDMPLFLSQVTVRQECKHSRHPLLTWLIFL